MRFCDKLPKLRKDNNLSQEQLAAELGVSRQAVSKWEAGLSYPDMEKMIQICSILNCNLDDLLDDGVIGNSSKNSQAKFNINNYFQDFLHFITKTSNMFSSMTLKEKIKCLFELLVIMFILLFIGTMAFSILSVITSNLLNLFPYHLELYLGRILDNLYLLLLIILGIIVFLHLFKIRYLDYFITIEDQNVKEKTVEEPIEKKENKYYIEPPKEKIIIRDPKHTSFSFFHFLGKIFLFVGKIFLTLCVLPVVLFFIFLIIMTVLGISHLSYGILFLWLSLISLSLAIICGIVIYFVYNFIFDQAIPFRKLWLIFLISLITLGLNIGLTITTLLGYEYTNEPVSFEHKIDYQYIEVDQDTLFFFDQEHFEYIIDNSLSDVKLEIYYAEGMDYSIKKYQNTYYLDTENFEPLKIYHLILKDLKNKTFRSYESDDFVYIKAYLSEENYNKLKNRNSIFD